MAPCLVEDALSIVEGLANDGDDDDDEREREPLAESR